MRREPPFIDPSVDRVLGYPEVGCHIEDSDPTFSISHLNPLISCENKDLCPPIKPDMSIRNLSIPINVKLLAGHEMKLFHTWLQTATGCRGFSGLVLSRLRSSNPPPQRARLSARRPISLTQASDRLAASKNPRACSIRVGPAVIRLLMVKMGFAHAGILNHPAPGARWHPRRPNPPRCRTCLCAPGQCAVALGGKRRSFSGRSRRFRTGTVSLTGSAGR